MPSKLYFAVAALLIIATALTGTTEAQNSDGLNYQIDMRAGGRIDIEREVGSYCITGAVKQQTIRGEGEISWHEVIRFAPGAMAIEERIEWSTFENALSNLTVTTSIRLCAPGISTADRTYSGGGYEIARGDIISPYHPLVRAGEVNALSLTDQYWNVSVSANPGHSAFLNTEFEAAYGNQIYLSRDEVPEDMERYSAWAASVDPVWPGYEEFRHGAEYSGNYFEIVQHLYTSDGLSRRATSLSSPFSLGRLVSDWEVEGAAEAWEEMIMHNIPRGAEARPVKWWYLF